METTEIKLRIIKSKEEDFVEDEPLYDNIYYEIQESEVEE